MKILIAVKRVIDHNVKIRVKADGSGVELTNVKMAINPFDEIAVEEAVRLKEAGKASEVVVVSIGEISSQEILRSAMALGADSAILLQRPADMILEPLDIARLLQQVVIREQPDLILLGKQAIDDDCNQTGQMLSALLEYPQGTFASQIIIEDGLIHVTREIDGGLETLSMPLPAIVTTDLRLNVPRYATLPNIMKAKKKPLEIMNIVEMDFSPLGQVKTINVSEPKKRSGQCTLLNNATALVSELKAKEVI
ncbi:electron transfer flavoprotein subunit beta/FixA family protein [Providencia sp.]|uniref:electron transfer flavoprotein subunit beta/FixA family protein n=1 Tax=Providencia sp. TaxID=589 RepID=UPI003F9B8D1C